MMSATTAAVRGRLSPGCIPGAVVASDLGTVGRVGEGDKDGAVVE